MKVVNKTNYDTRYLRSLFIKCEKHEGTNYKYRQVEVLNKRGGGTSGRAWVNSRYVTMKLSSQAHSRSVAQVYIHEVGHNLGLRHKDMASVYLIDVSWLVDEPIPSKKPKASKPKPNIVEVRANHAQKKLDEWTKKFHRAKTYVKKYRKKVKYYEKKKAASPKAENKGTLPLK